MFRQMLCLGTFLLLAGIAIIATAAQEPAGTDEANDLWVVCEPAAETPSESIKTIVLISGDEEYRSEEVMPMLGRLLSDRGPFRCVVLFAINPETGEIDPNVQTNIPGMEQLKQADLVVMALRFRQLPDEQMCYFDDYIKRGGPVIGLRTSTHAFRYPGDSESDFRTYSFDSKEWPGGFGRQILGETWISHHGGHGTQSTRGVIEKENADHPIVDAVDDVWGPSDVYGVTNLPEDAVILMRGQVLESMEPDSPPVPGKLNDPMMPLVWCRELPIDGQDQKQKIVCTTMGAAGDFAHPGLRRVLQNSVYWCLNIELEQSVLDSIWTKEKFDPTFFGFNGFRKGMKPADFSTKADKFP